MDECRAAVQDAVNLPKTCKRGPEIGWVALTQRAVVQAGFQGAGAVTASSDRFGLLSSRESLGTSNRMRVACQRTTSPRRLRLTERRHVAEWVPAVGAQRVGAGELAVANPGAVLLRPLDQFGREEIVGSVGSRKRALKPGHKLSVAGARGAVVASPPTGRTSVFDGLRVG